MANPLSVVRVMGTIILFRSHICISETVTCPKDADCECVGDEPCVLNCIGKDFCKGGHTLTCRASQPCTLLCSGEQACTDSFFVGNGASSVSVECMGGKACSGNTEIVCARNTPCSVTCESGNCESLDIAANAASSFECTGNGCSLASSVPAPYAAPTSAPSPVPAPSLTPSANPSTIPSELPTRAPSSAAPTRASSVEPSAAGPTRMPSLTPTTVSSSPTPLPTTEPTTEPSFDISLTDDDEYIDIVFVSISSAALCVFTLCLYRNCAQQRKRQSLTDRNSAPSPKHDQQPSDETDIESGPPRTPDVTPPSITIATSPQPNQLHILDDSAELDEIPELDKIDKPSMICGCTVSRLKKAYLWGMFILTFTLLFLKQFVPSVDEFFDEGQAFIVNWFEAHHWLHILLVILLIAVAKGVGIKDPLSLRTMAVVILACQAADNNAARYVIAALIMSFQSSMAKLLEYYLVGDELQVVMGTPVHYVFQYARKALSLSRFCSEDSLKWLNPKWTLEISHKARDNPDMHIMNNFKSTFCKRRGGNMFTRGALWVIEFVLCVVWTSMIEWVSPISELFLYMHNWDLKARNVLVIVCSELADFDRMIELGIFLSAYPDLLGGKVDSLVAKPLAWAIGYMLVMPLTLRWAYKLHSKAQTKPAEEGSPEADQAQGNLSRASLSYGKQAMSNAQTDTSSTDQVKRTSPEMVRDLRRINAAATREEQARNDALTDTSKTDQIRNSLVEMMGDPTQLRRMILNGDAYRKETGSTDTEQRQQNPETSDAQAIELQCQGQLSRPSQLDREQVLNNLQTESGINRVFQQFPPPQESAVSSEDDSLEIMQQQQALREQKAKRNFYLSSPSARGAQSASSSSSLGRLGKLYADGRTSSMSTFKEDGGIWSDSDF